MRYEIHTSKLICVAQSELREINIGAKLSTLKDGPLSESIFANFLGNIEKNDTCA